MVSVYRRGDGAEICGLSEFAGDHPLWFGWNRHRRRIQQAGQLMLTPLAMVTTLMKQTMPDKLITKALFADCFAFNTNWNCHTLASNLDYGWQMSYYGGDANSRLRWYTCYGMKKNQLCLGFSAEQGFSGKWCEIRPQASQTIALGYAGGMMFAYENQPASIGLMKTMVNSMDGPGNWNKIGETLS